MAEQARTGGKGVQVAVMGTLAVAVVVVFGVALYYVHTPTITAATGLVGLGLLLAIVYLLFEL